MTSLEIIAVMGSRQSSFDSIRVGGKLTRTEIAGMLSGLSDKCVALALAKYGGDSQSVAKVVAFAQLWAAVKATREGWQVERGLVIARLAEMAAMEVIKPCACRKCKGVGFTGIKVCGRCNGAGISRLFSDKAIADYAQLTESTFRRTWRPRYSAMYRYVCELDAEINEHFQSY